MRQAEQPGTDEGLVPPRGMSRAARIGWLMALWLAVQTAVEYAIAQVLNQNLPIMVVINVAEAASIIVYFMHLPRLWQGREKA